MNFQKLVGAVVLSAATVPAFAQANLITNGNFEALSTQALVLPNDYTTINAGPGPSPIEGWTVGGSIDLIRNNYGAISNVSIDLAGTPGPGFIEQAFNVLAGYTYTLTFDYNNNNNTTSPLDVTFGGVLTSFPLNVTLPATGTLSFLAAANGTSTVRFASASGNNFGAVVDNISVTAVPEPESVVLALAALAIVGGAARKRAS